MLAAKNLDNIILPSCITNLDISALILEVQQAVENNETDHFQYLCIFIQKTRTKHDQKVIEPILKGRKLELTDSSKIIDLNL